MATPPFSIDQAVPGGADVAALFPALERTFRDVVESWLLIDHDNTGQHAKVTFTSTGGTDPSFSAGVVGLWNNNGILKTRIASGAVAIVDAFASGVKVPFFQAVVPTNWVPDVSQTDRVLRMVDANGGGVGGDWDGPVGGAWRPSYIDVVVGSKG